MADIRTPLKIGSELTYLKTVYTITEVMGKGSNAICYKAEYCDTVSPDQNYGILIKELFPLDENGLIRRGNGDDIDVADKARGIFETHKKSFMRGRDISIKLSKDFPEKTMNVINTFEQNKTLYMSIIISGGYSLSEKQCSTLKEAVAYISGILRALRHFHDNGLLHLDISPDNILVFRKDKDETEQRAMLIDYNSVFSADEINSSKADYISKKKPFTAPEVLSESCKNIKYYSDLYAVTAIFARLILPGFSQGDTIDIKAIARSITPNLAIFENIPATAFHKTVEILKKGLNPLLRNRYADIGKYLDDLRELSDRIDNIGITISALWEVSAAVYKDMTHDNHSYDYLIDDSIPSQIDYDSVRNDACVFISGDGGIGKTTSLLRIWRELVLKFDISKPVPVYIKLDEYDKSKLLISRCLKKLKFSEKTLTTGEAERALVSVLDREANSNSSDCSVLFLLDGFNEVRESQKDYLKSEIDEMRKYKNVAIIVASRSFEEFPGFRNIALNPLSNSKVQSFLNARNLVYPDDGGMKILLGNPMLLSLYAKVTESTGENTTVYTKETLIKAYTRYLISNLPKQNEENRKNIEAAWFVTDIILPQIAEYMLKSQINTISLYNLKSIITKNYKIVLHSSFIRTFKKNMPSIKIIENITGVNGIIGAVGNIRPENDFFDRIITNILCSKLALLYCTHNGEYSFSHQIFRDYFAPNIKQIQNKLNVIKFRLIAPKLAVSFLLTIVVFVAATWGISYQSKHRVFPNPNNPAEVEAVKNTLESVAASTAKFAAEAQERQKLFNKFNALLNADNDAYIDRLNDLKKELNKQEQFINNLTPPSSEKFGEYIKQLSNYKNNTISINALDELFNFAAAFEEKDKQIIAGLFTLLNPEEIANKIGLDGDKSEAVGYYRDWLENQIAQAAVMLRYIISSVPGSYQIELFQKSDLTVVGKKINAMEWSSYEDYQAKINALRDNKSGGEGEILYNLSIRGVKLE